MADIVIPGHQFGQGIESAPGSEAFVLFTLGILAFLFGAFTAAGIVLWYRGKRPLPHRQLLMDIDEEETLQPPKSSFEEESPAEPWSRSADWWKK